MIILLTNRGIAGFIYLVPGPVTSVRASTINTTTIGLSWEAPQILGPLVDAYEIHYTTQCGEQKMAGNISVDNQTLSLKLTALEEAQTYTISLTAENSLGSGETMIVLANTMSTSRLIKRNVFGINEPMMCDCVLSL